MTKIPTIGTSKLTESFGIAAGMAHTDQGFIKRWYCLLCLPALLELFFSDYIPHGSNDLTLHTLALVDALLASLFFYQCVTRWLVKIRSDESKEAQAPLGLFLLWSLIFWATLYLPSYLPLVMEDELLRNPGLGAALQLCAFVLLGFGALFNLRYYFYFLPIFCGEKRSGRILAESWQIAASSLRLPFQAVSGPLAVWLFLSALPSIVFPDGRSLALNVVGALLTPAFNILSCYVALAVGLIILDSSRRESYAISESKLNAQFFETLLESPYWLRWPLIPANAAKLMIIAIFLHLGNFMSLMSSKPAPELTIRSISVQGKEVSLRLELNDPAFSFRGFEPIHLALAGEQHQTVAAPPTQIQLAGNEDISQASNPLDLRFWLPRSESHVILDLKFEAFNRSDKEISELKDLYLWYRYWRGPKIEFKSEVPTPPGAATI